MVRSIVGTLVDIGRGRRIRDGFAALLAAGDRSVAASSPRPRACVLWEVGY